MISEKETIKISKFLSLVLRHQPEAIGIELDENGWTDVAGLLAALNKKGVSITMTVLEQVVATNHKKRFAFNNNKTRIRANQGHSVAVALGYHTQQPPPVLYHGTAKKNSACIIKEGLQKQTRHHVHLSTDKETAIRVGQRHGKPVVFTIEAQAVQQEGYPFFVSDNGVWLTDHVPPKFLKQL